MVGPLVPMFPNVANGAIYKAQHLTSTRSRHRVCAKPQSSLILPDDTGMAGLA